MGIRAYLIPPGIIAALAMVLCAFNVFEPLQTLTAAGVAQARVDTRVARPVGRSTTPSVVTMQARAERGAAVDQVRAFPVRADLPATNVAMLSPVPVTSLMPAQRPISTEANLHESNDVEVLVGDVEKGSSEGNVSAEESYVVPPTLTPQATPLEAQAELGGDQPDLAVADQEIAK